MRWLWWREPAKNRRTEITWKQFDEMANRVANALMERGIGKGDKVIHLMVNCLEWLPFYFGILRTGAWAVPLNFRFSGDDIRYCADIAEAKAIIFGEEFIDRITEVKDDLKTIRDFVFVGPQEVTPSYCDHYKPLLDSASPIDPKVHLK